MIKYQAHIGIDPGLFGAVCIYSPDNFLSVIDIPLRKVEGFIKESKTKEVDCQLLNSQIIEQIRENNVNILTMHMERVYGRGGNSAQSTFSLGDSMGSIRATVALAANPDHEIYSLPKVWKSALKLSADKQKSIDLAISIEPKMVNFLTHSKHHDRAEAFLLAYMSYNFYEDN